MRKFFTFLVFVSLAGLASAETTGRGGLYFGTKSLKHSDWGDLDKQAALGINLDVKDVSWPVWISAAFISSRDQETIITSASPLATREIEGKTSEFHLGVKKDFYPVKIFRLSAGGGPAFVRASLDNPVSPYNTDSDSGFGYWLGAEGVLYLGHISLGIGYNYSQAKVTLLNRSLDAGGSNLAFSIGFGW